MKYLVVIEEAGTGFSAYSPDIDGCVAAGATFEETEERMAEAVRFHFDGLRGAGEEVPTPRSRSTYVDVPA